MRKRIFAVLILCVGLFMLVLPAMAGSMTWSDPSGSGITISFTTPDTYNSCTTPGDTIFTTGVPSDWSVRGWVRLDWVIPEGRQPIQEWDINTNGDLNLYIPYPDIGSGPTVSEDLHELHVDMSLSIYDADGNRIDWVGGDQVAAPGTLGPGQDWDVYCNNPPPPPPGGGEGCTPGYWKQPQHLDSWVGYSPSDDFGTVFGVSRTISLIDALGTGGGGEKALGRHAVAALLNAASSVDYTYSTADVISMVQQAYTSDDFEGVKNLFAAENESGCPLN